MADKENSNFGLSLKDMGLDNIADGGIDALLSENNDAAVAETDKAVTQDADVSDDFIDFNDFSIDDLDTALSKYGDGDIEQPLTDDDNGGADTLNRNDVHENEQVGVSQNLDLHPSSEAEKVKSDDEFSQVADKSQAERVSVTPEMPKTIEVASDKIEDGYSQDSIDKQTMGNLVWYDGTLGEKVYEISLNNMPEFLDYDSSIKTIHVNIESPYGWNVFFENGVFMNLMDLKEYQERHGNLPGHNGKIIYGNRMSSFEKIDRIVVYSKPRYFAYGLKK